MSMHLLSKSIQQKNRTHKLGAKLAITTAVSKRDGNIISEVLTPKVVTKKENPKRDTIIVRRFVIWLHTLKWNISIVKNVIDNKNLPKSTH